MMKNLLTACIGFSLFCSVEAQAKTYTTSFPATENPISEGGNWVNGQSLALDWSNVRTTSGLAFGTQPGPSGYNDSTALLTGTWGPNQTVQATVHTVNQQTGSVYEEVEVRLRSTASPHSITGYEINFRCSSDGQQYVSIVRWNGGLGNFTEFGYTGGPGLFDGDVVMGTAVGNVITAYINGVQIYQVTDNAFTSGNPGIGFYLAGATGLDSDFGFSSVTAWDVLPPGVPTNLRILPPVASAAGTMAPITGAPSFAPAHASSGIPTENAWSEALVAGGYFFHDISEPVDRPPSRPTAALMLSPPPAGY
jgi:hypothetical protein